MAKKKAAKVTKKTKVTKKKTSSKSSGSSKKGVQAKATSAEDSLDDDMDLEVSDSANAPSLSTIAAEALNDENNSARQAAMALSASTLKNFRHHPDIENFYRFIYENDLRFEALELISQKLEEKRTKRAIKLAKKAAH